MLLFAQFPFYRFRRLQASPMDNEYKIIATTKRKDVDCTVPYKNGEVNDDTAVYYENIVWRTEVFKTFDTKYME